MSGRRRWLRLAVGSLGFTVVVSACSAVFPSRQASPGSTPSLLPGEPVPSELLEPLGPILVLRAYSGIFRSHQERTEFVTPQLAVFDDGTIVLNVALPGDVPVLRSIRLSSDEIGQVEDALREAKLRSLAAGGLAEGSLCDDCGTTIIRVEIDGTTIEIAAEALDSNANETWLKRLPYGPGPIAVDRLLSALAERVRTGPSEPFVGRLPEIPVAPIRYGG